MNRWFLRAIIGLIFVIIILPFFLPKKDVSSVGLQGTPVAASVHSVKADNFAPGQLQAHFIKHGYQFGAISQENYLEDAKKLLDAPQGTGILEKIRENGDILRYNPSTKEFAVMTKTGRIRTYFKTSDQYWNKQ